MPGDHPVARACNLRCRMLLTNGAKPGAYHELAQLATLDLELVLRTGRECLPRKPAFEFFGS